MIEEQLRRRLEERVGEYSVSHEAPPDVFRRARLRMARNAVAVLATIGLVAAGTIFGLGSTFGRGAGLDRDSTIGPAQAPVFTPGCSPEELRPSERWTSPRFVLASGAHRGEGWSFCFGTVETTDERANNNSTSIPCFDARFGRDEGTGFTCSLDESLAPGAGVVLGIVWPDRGFVSGAVPPETERVQLRTPSEGVGTTTLIDSPAGLETDFKFFVALTDPYPSDVTVVASDAEGNVLAQRPIGTVLPLAVERSGGGSGTVLGVFPELAECESCLEAPDSFKWIDCGTKCDSGLARGEMVVLLARPESGSRFIGWSGDCSGTSPRCDLVMDTRKAIEARFESE